MKTSLMNVIFITLSLFLVNIEKVNCEENSNIKIISRAINLRDYYAPITASILKDIRFIIMTLGNEPIIKLKNYKPQLEDAGNRLDEVHPLNFWRVIFTDEKLTSAIHNIYKRKKVWKNFIKGMGKSLDEAVERNNLNHEYIEDFAKQIGIDIRLIKKPIDKKDWEEFAKSLLSHVHRNGHLDRYDQ